MKDLILKTADNIIEELRSMGCSIDYDEAIEMAMNELATLGYNTEEPVNYDLTR